MSNKQRLSASVDAELIEAAEADVRKGRAASLSAWVNDALRLKLEKERRLSALARFIAGYEAEHGAITDEDVLLAQGRVESRAVRVRRGTAGRRTRGARGR